MSILLFGVSSTSVLPKLRTNSDSNDGHTPPPPLNSPRATPRLVSGHHPPPLACSPGTAEQGEGSQPVRQACSPHQLRESTRQACILTSLADTNPGVLQSSLEDFSNRGERSHGEGMGLREPAAAEMTEIPDCGSVNVCFCFYSCEHETFKKKL